MPLSDKQLNDLTDIHILLIAYNLNLARSLTEILDTMHQDTLLVLENNAAFRLLFIAMLEAWDNDNQPMLNEAMDVVRMIVKTIKDVENGEDNAKAWKAMFKKCSWGGKDATNK